MFSHPRRNLISRLVVGAENLGFRLMRREFRVFAHPPEAMLAVLGEHGLEARFAERGFAWEARGLSPTQPSVAPRGAACVADLAT